TPTRPPTPPRPAPPPPRTRPSRPSETESPTAAPSWSNHTAADHPYLVLGGRFRSARFGRRGFGAGAGDQVARPDLVETGEESDAAPEEERRRGRLLRHVENGDDGTLDEEKQRRREEPAEHNSKCRGPPGDHSIVDLVEIAHSKHGAEHGTGRAPADADQDVAHGQHG